MAKDNTWTFTEEEVKTITALPKRQFKLGAGNMATGYYDDNTGKFYECDAEGTLTGRIGNYKKQTTIVIPPSIDPADRAKAQAAAQQKEKPPVKQAPLPDWREIKKQEKERQREEKQREREQRKQEKQSGTKERKPSASDKAGTSVVPVGTKGKLLPKLSLILSIVSLVAALGVGAFIIINRTSETTTEGFTFPLTVQRGDGTVMSTSYVTEAQQVIQVTDDVLPGGQLSKDNLASATIPASLYNYAVSIGHKPCSVELAKEVIGTYATEYIGTGQYLCIDQYSTDDTGGIELTENPWLAGDGEDVRDYLWTDDTSFLMFGRQAIITIKRTVDSSNPALREELYEDDATIEYEISEKDQNNNQYETIKIYAVVSDLLNSEGTVLYNSYAKLGAIPQGELEQYVKNHVTIAKMVPSIVRFRMTEKAATVYDAAIVTGADTTLTSGTVTTVELLEELEADTPVRATQLRICQFVDKILCGGVAPDGKEDPID